MQYITQGVLADGTPDATRQRLLARTPPSTSRIVKEPICPPPAGVGTSFQLPKKPEESEAPPRFLVPSSPGAGGADRDRTGDPLLAKQVLSQLSYSPDPLELRLPPRLAVGGSGWIRTIDPRLIKTVL